MPGKRLILPSFGAVAGAALLLASPRPASAAPTVIPQSKFVLQHVDSEETSGENGAAKNAFDGSASTFWSTQWLGAQPSQPHELHLNLGGIHHVTGFRYLPRQGSVANGRIAEYEFYVSSDGVAWGSPVATGVWPNSTAQQQVLFTPVVGQYVRLRSLSEVAGRPFTTVAELNVLQEGTPINEAPNGSIVSPASDLTVAVGGQVSFSATGTDPDGGEPLSFLWDFGAGSGVPVSTEPSPGLIQFDQPGTFTVTLTVSDFAGLEDPTPATRTITVTNSAVTPVPQSSWSLLFVDSQETVGENGAATNAFDGNPSTFWSSQWKGGAPLPPHEIQINLGGVHNLTGFRYLPRQGTVPNGRIAQFEFYVSSDGVNWGAPLVSGLWPNTAAEQEVLFPPTIGQFVRLRALTEVAGRAFTTLAELNVLQSGPPLNLAPNGIIVTPASAVTIDVGETVDFSATASDPDTTTPLAYRWTFGTGSGVPDSTALNPGAVPFDASGTFTVTFTVTDAEGLADPTPSTVTVNVQGSAIGPIPSDNWVVHFVDSQETVGEYAPATNAFDGNANTFWSTQWQGTMPAHPHDLQINLAGIHTVRGFRYLPRQGTVTNGRIAQYEFYVSADGIDWGSPVATGTFPNTAAWQEVLFTPKIGQFVRLRALSEVAARPMTTLAELQILQEGPPLNLAPNGTILSPSDNLTISVGESVAFAGEGSDPDANTPLGYTWNFGTGSDIPDSTEQNPGAVQFGTAGTFTVSLRVTDANGLADPTPATRTIIVQGGPMTVIPRSSYVLHFVDSQETAGENGAATNAFDGNSATFWSTQWQGAQPPLPHELHLNLGGIHRVRGFRYLPRQGSVSNGRIAQYEFYVSTDGINWGAPVATGTWSNSSAQQEVLFPSKVGQYTRLRALSEVAGRPFTTVAELNILQEGEPLNLSPDGSIAQPSGNVVISVGDTVDFGGTGTDPDNHTPLTYLWQFGAGSGVPDSTAQAPGSVAFNIPGTYTISLKVTDALGLADPTLPTRTITVLPEASTNQPPNGTISLPTADVMIPIGGTVEFAGSGSDPDSNTPLSYLWNFGAGSGIPNATTASPGVLPFNSPGTFTITFTVTDSLGLADPTPATRTITVSAAATTPIPRINWQLHYVDSEETTGENGSAFNALDANPATFWSTQWSGGFVFPPHEFQVDLGTGYNVAGFRYLPRQDGVANGRIAQYEFYVSDDGVNWGAPLATGTFANTAVEKQVLFTPTPARFVRLRAVTEVAGRAFTTMAEFNVLEGPRLVPSVRITQPLSHHFQSSPTLTVTADPRLQPGQGQGVRFTLDGSPVVIDDYGAPYSGTFTELPLAEHTVHAQVIDAAGVPVAGIATQDTSTQVAIGDYFVGFGDSITNGSHDNIATDNTSADARNMTRGFTPILSDTLTAARGHPVLVANEGVSGNTAANGLARINTVLQNYPQAQAFLIMFGTNDASQGVPSGLGLSPGSPGYAGSFKANMQLIIDAIVAAGKTPILAKAPVYLPINGTFDLRQQAYNDVIDELVADPNNFIPIAPPDFYAYFAAHHAQEYDDAIHPNGLGYQSMADIWAIALEP